MPAPKGHPRYGGRKKGTPNRWTADMRRAFESAFWALQDDPQANLLAWARNDPGAFYKLISRILPGEGMSNPGMVALTVVTGVSKRMR